MGKEERQGEERKESKRYDYSKLSIESTLQEHDEQLKMLWESAGKLEDKIE